MSTWTYSKSRIGWLTHSPMMPSGSAARLEWAVTYAARAARFWQVRYRVALNPVTGMYEWKPQEATS